MKKTFTLPFFEGFYNTHHGDRIEVLSEDDCDWEIERAQEAILERFAIDEKDLAAIMEDRNAGTHYIDWLYDKADVDYKGLKESYASEWTDDFLREYADALALLGISKIKFNNVSSPRYYNYSTDQIVVEATVNMRKLERTIQWHVKNAPQFAAYIKEEFTSYDGFMSFYPNQADEWFAKAKGDWNHTEISTVVDYWCKIGAGVPCPLFEPLEDGSLPHGDDAEYYGTDYFGEDWSGNNSWWDYCTNSEAVSVDAYIAFLKETIGFDYRKRPNPEEQAELPL